MRKLLAALLVLLAGAGSLAGCDLHLGPYAAVVDGTTISQGVLNTSLASVASNHDYLCSVTGGSPSAIATTGAGAGTYDAAFADFVLRNLVWAQLATDEAAREHATVTSLTQSLAKEQVTSGLGTSVQGCSGTGTAIFGQLAPDYRNALVILNADLDALSALREGITLTNDGLTQYANAHPEDAELVCTSYLQAATTAVAQQVIAAVKKGTSFATEVAKATGNQPTGVPCMPLGQFPTQIASALLSVKVGGVTQPISYQQSIYVFQLTSVQAATQAQFLQTVVGNLSNEFSAVLAQMERSGSVQLDPAYGSWCAAGSSSGPILPPVSPPTKDLPTPAAVFAQPPASSTTLPSCKAG